MLRNLFAGFTLIGIFAFAISGATANAMHQISPLGTTPGIRQAYRIDHELRELKEPKASEANGYVKDCLRQIPGVKDRGGYLEYETIATEVQYVDCVKIALARVSDVDVKPAVVPVSVPSNITIDYGKSDEQKKVSEYIKIDQKSPPCFPGPSVRVEISNAKTNAVVETFDASPGDTVIVSPDVDVKNYRIIIKIGDIALVHPEPESMFTIPCGEKEELYIEGFAEVIDRMSGGESFIVETKNAIIGTKGTRFTVDARDPNMTVFAVTEGAIEIRPKNPSLPIILLSAGRTVGVSSAEVTKITKIGMVDGAGGLSWGMIAIIILVAATVAALILKTILR